MSIFKAMQNEFDNMLDEEEEEELHYEEASLKGLKKKELIEICNELEISSEGTNKELKARILGITSEVLDVGNDGVKATKENEDDTGAGATGSRI